MKFIIGQMFLGVQIWGTFPITERISILFMVGRKAFVPAVA